MQQGMAVWASGRMIGELDAETDVQMDSSWACKETPLNQER